MGSFFSKLFLQILPELVFRLLCIGVLVSCIRVAGGFSGAILFLIFIFTVGIMLALFLVPADGKAARHLRQIRFGWIVAIGAVFISMNLFANMDVIPDSLPMRHCVDQHIYQSRDMDKKSLPDAFIRELVRNREVTVPYRIEPYSYYNPIVSEEERGSGFVRNYYIECNYTRYFSEYSGKCYIDESLPRVDEVGSSGINMDDFTDLGIANDMLRYTFLLNREHSKETKYFWYSWYYYSFAEEEDWFPHIYVNFDSCDEKHLVALWDDKENLYLMGRSYYEN